MGWISLLLIFITRGLASELPKFLTKYPMDSIRFITQEGDLAYLRKRPGVLGLVKNFRSNDFLSDEAHNDFLVTASRFRQRVAIEVVPHSHTSFDLLKKHQILTADWGQTAVKEIGMGRSPTLHLQDEWISYFDPAQRVIVIKNIITERKYEITLSNKLNVFFMPDVQMINSETVVYSDINESGIAAVIQLNILTKKTSVIYKASLPGTRMEICQEKGYLAIGEFPYEGIHRGSKILQIKLTDATNLAGHHTLYSTVNEDLGNMVCLKDSIFFLKTLGHNKKINLKVTEAARLDLKSEKVEIKSSLSHVTQLINIDGRIIIPFRGELFVLEGRANLSEDVLYKAPKKKEELPLDI